MIPLQFNYKKILFSENRSVFKAPAFESVVDGGLNEQDIDEQASYSEIIKGKIKSFHNKISVLLEKFNTTDENAENIAISALSNQITDRILSKEKDQYLRDLVLRNKRAKIKNQCKIT